MPMQCRVSEFHILGFSYRIFFFFLFLFFVLCNWITLYGIYIFWLIRTEMLVPQSAPKSSWFPSGVDPPTKNQRVSTPAHSFWSKSKMRFSSDLMVQINLFTNEVYSVENPPPKRFSGGYRKSPAFSKQCPIHHEKNPTYYEKSPIMRRALYITNRALYITINTFLSTPSRVHSHLCENSYFPRKHVSAQEIHLFEKRPVK